MSFEPAFLKNCNSDADVDILSPDFDVGRCKAAKLILMDVSVSRCHCKFLCDENRQWTLLDLSSSGTFINQILVGKGNKIVLKDEDEVNIGPVSNNLCWKFFHSKNSEPAKKKFKPDNSIVDDIEAQSQVFEEMFQQQSVLEKRMNDAATLANNMDKERNMLEKEFRNRLANVEQSLSSANSPSSAIKVRLEKQLTVEKSKLREEFEMQKRNLENRIKENNIVENDLKTQITNLQHLMGVEKSKWEQSFNAEKLILEAKMKEKEMELENEKSKVAQSAQQKEEELNKKLVEQEQEKQDLARKIAEMENIQMELNKKLEQSEMNRVSEKLRLEEEMKLRVADKEDQLKRQLDKRVNELMVAKHNLELQVKEEIDKKESEKVVNLTKELELVKTSLTQVEGKKCVLEKELAEASAVRTESSKVKSDLLDNFEQLLEAEFQCSICSELFVTAITLNCTHTFCKFCISEWKKKKKDCPICRTKIKSENRSIVMDNYIEKMIENLSQAAKERRRELVLERYGGTKSKKDSRQSGPSTSTATTTVASTSRPPPVNETPNTTRRRRHQPIQQSSSSSPIQVVQVIDLTGNTPGLVLRPVVNNTNNIQGVTNNRTPRQLQLRLVTNNGLWAVQSPTTKNN